MGEPSEAVGCVALSYTWYVSSAYLKLTTNWPDRALVGPGKLPELWSDRECQTLGAAPGIEPGTSRITPSPFCANGGANDPLAHSLAHPLASLTHSLETLAHPLAPLAIR